MPAVAPSARRATAGSRRIAVSTCGGLLGSWSYLVAEAVHEFLLAVTRPHVVVVDDLHAVQLRRRGVHGRFRVERQLVRLQGQKKALRLRAHHPIEVLLPLDDVRGALY